MDWSKLQNGSDIRGVAIGGVEGEEVNLTPQVATQLGAAFVKWLTRFANENDISLAVGTDSRISGSDLKEAFITGAVSAGAKVYDCGMASTPAMFMTTLSKTNPTTAGVMITASHLPYNRNGFKFFTKSGGLDKKDISEILKIAGNEKYAHETNPPSVVVWNFIDEYSAYLVDYIRKEVNNEADVERPLSGLKIIVDAGNGAGGFFASKVLEPLGAEMKGSQYLDPDGYFPNHVPNPEDKVAMESICNAVVKEKADLGVIFDTDVDRSAIVDSEGNPVNRNALIALIAAVVLDEHPNTTIVTDSITSEGLKKFIEFDLKGKHHRFKRGYKNVINEALRLNNEGEESWLAIETSGHAALKENHFLDDGAFLVAKLLVAMAKMNTKGEKLTSLIQKLEQPVESKEFRFSILDDDFQKYGEMVLNKLQNEISEMPGWELVSPNYEGIRVKCNSENEKGWFLLRMSLHDPVMPLNIESDVVGGINAISNKLKELMIKFAGLNI